MKEEGDRGNVGSPVETPATAAAAMNTQANNSSPAGGSLSVFRRISTSIMGASPADTAADGGTLFDKVMMGRQSTASTTASPAPSQPCSQPVVLGQLLGTSRWWQGPETKSEELRTYFGLPKNETFLDDYNCALRRRFLHQGRLYIFDHYVCFDSFVFGFAKKLVIPLESVTAVKKRTNLRFPNSIKIEVDGRDGDQPSCYFFTSFLSRDDAFQLLNNCLSQTRLETNWHRRSLQDGTPSYDGGPAAAPAGDSVLSDERSSSGGTVGQADGRPSGVAESLAGWQGPGPGSPTTPTQHHHAAQHRTARVMLSSPRRASVGANGHAGPVNSSRIQRETQDHDDDEDEAEGVEGVWCHMADGPPPGLASDAQVVISAVMQGTPRQLFDVLFADNSHVLEDFLESQGNRRINLSSWTRDSQLGLVRDIQFISPIKGAFANWGVPTTQCMQSHRFRRFQGDYLVFESSQTMTDIPYGDCFTVDMRWDIAPFVNGAPLKPGEAPALASEQQMASPFTSPAAHAMSAPTGEPPKLQVSIAVRVPFSRRCLFKRVIESGAVKQVKDTYTLLMQQLHDTMAQIASDQAPVQLGSQGRQGLPHVSSFSARPEASLAGLPSISPAGVLEGPHSSGTHAALPAVGSQGLNGAPTRNPSIFNNLVSLDGQQHSRDSMHLVKDGGHKHGLAGYHRQPSSRLGRMQNGLRGIMQGMQVLVPRELWVGGSNTSPQLLLTLLVLCVQLLVLFSTWRASRQHPVVGHHHMGLGLPHAAAPVLNGSQLEGGGSLLATSKEMWSQRAALLQVELDLMQQHITAITQQMQLALSRAAAAE